MKPFLKKLFLFLIGPFVLCVLIYLFFNYVVHQELKSYRDKSDLKTLFIGDSHIQMTINDHLLSHSINLARDSEGFKFSLLKIKTILKVNPSIDKIYLGLSYHNLSSNYDDFIYGKYAYQISSRYFFLLTSPEKAKILKENSGNLFPFLFWVFKSGLKTCLKSRNYFYLGYYHNSFASTSVMKSSVDKRIAFQYFDNGKVAGFSNVNINHLKEIIQFCKAKKVQLIFLSTPLHPYYKSKIPEKFKEKYAEIINQNHLKVINFSNLVLTDSCYIPDGDHVSEVGATLVTNQFKNKK